MELIIFGAIVAISIIYGKDSEEFVSLFGMGLEKTVRVFDDESMDCGGGVRHILIQINYYLQKSIV